MDRQIKYTRGIDPLWFVVQVAALDFSLSILRATASDSRTSHKAMPGAGVYGCFLMLVQRATAMLAVGINFRYVTVQFYG